MPMGRRRDVSHCISVKADMELECLFHCFTFDASEKSLDPYKLVYDLVPVNSVILRGDR